MLKVFVLVCAVSVNHADCQVDTAADVIRSMQVKSAEQCGFMGQAQMASAAELIDPKTQYMKVVCLRNPEQAKNGTILQR